MATSILNPAKAATQTSRRRHAAAPALLHPQAVTAEPSQPTHATPDAPLWGHLGLRLTGDERTRWYPISQEQADGLIEQLQDGSPWIAAKTLNNRVLLIQPAALHRLVLLDDDADEPEGDWGASAEPVAGGTHLHYRDAAAAVLRLDAQASWSAFNAVRQGWELPALLHLACWGEGMDFYAPRERVALLDMPLHLMRDAEADELAQLRAESERRELKRAA